MKQKEELKQHNRSNICLWFYISIYTTKRRIFSSSTSSSLIKHTIAIILKLVANVKST